MKGDQCTEAPHSKAPSSRRSTRTMRGDSRTRRSAASRCGSYRGSSQSTAEPTRFRPPRRFPISRTGCARAAWHLVPAMPLALLVAAAGGYWLSRRALAPVDRITQTARLITADSLSKRLEVAPTGDELERLSQTSERDDRAARERVSKDHALHGRRVSRAAHAARGDADDGRSRAPRAATSRGAARGSRANRRRDRAHVASRRESSADREGRLRRGRPEEGAHRYRRGRARGVLARRASSRA